MDWFKKNKKNMKNEKSNNDSYYEFNHESKNIDDFYKDVFGKDFDQYFKDILNGMNDAQYKQASYGGYKYDDFIKPKIDNSLDNAFKLLKLDKNDDEKTIKKRYRELSMKWHPYKFQNNTEENQGIATRNFKKLNAAYELIKKFKQIK